jgi:hypothetical protein
MRSMSQSARAERRSLRGPLAGNKGPLRSVLFPEASDDTASAARRDAAARGRTVNMGRGASIKICFRQKLILCTVLSTGQLMPRARTLPKAAQCHSVARQSIGGVPVTVCIATLFTWNYAPAGEEPRTGVAAITASDRMITAADIQYEPQQQKIAYFGRSLVLVAGDIGIHSQAIRETEKEIRGRQLSPHDIALTYGRAVQAINRRQAENEILAPLGLNTDIFQAQQKDLSDGFLSMITGQLQNRRPIDTEALVVGSDGERAQIYSIDAYGNETCLDGIGFGAIGIGAWHAKSRLMQVGHTGTRNFAPALASTFAAKKNAEIAPGVGSSTDINIVLKDAIFPLWDHVTPELGRLYKKYLDEVSKFGDLLVDELQQFINKPQDKNQQTENDKAGKESPRENTPVDGSAGPDAAEASRENEGGEEGKEIQT